MAFGFINPPHNFPCTLIKTVTADKPLILSLTVKYMYRQIIIIAAQVFQICFKSGISDPLISPL